MKERGDTHTEVVIGSDSISVTLSLSPLLILHFLTQDSIFLFSLLSSPLPLPFISTSQHYCSLSTFHALISTTCIIFHSFYELPYSKNCILI
ncbi:hypothetical protein RIF29_04821 [Crotalaria pallida]|uniref:Uncharacterized protein n=1 Tax=Crotalaria pallida TaxID=3830 RepID=A0AAN9J264_CROPI